MPIRKTPPPGLKVAMMDANGEVGKSFQDINKLAIGPGNQLPGTTADFQNMMQMLVRQGIPAENILGGVGKATAYLAVQLKKHRKRLPSLPQRCRMLPERRQKT